MKILIIEDNPDIKELLDFILVDDGHESVLCPDGCSLQRIDEIDPDLVLIDEVLGNERGSCLIKEFKRKEDHQHIPVVLLSAMTNLKDIAEDCGADDYLEKPFNIRDLTELIRKYA